MEQDCAPVLPKEPNLDNDVDHTIYRVVSVTDGVIKVKPVLPVGVGQLVHFYCPTTFASFKDSLPGLVVSSEQSHSVVFGLVQSSLITTNYIALISPPVLTEKKTLSSDKITKAQNHDESEWPVNLSQKLPRKGDYKLYFLNFFLIDNPAYKLSSPHRVASDHTVADRSAYNFRFKFKISDILGKTINLFGARNSKDISSSYLK